MAHPETTDGAEGQAFDMSMLRRVVLIFRAAARYCSISTGEVPRTSAMLSNP
jgi:hypothetical protein